MSYSTLFDTDFIVFQRLDNIIFTLCIITTEYMTYPYPITTYTHSCTQQDNTSNEHIFGATTAAAHQSASNTNCVITVVSERSDELLHASARYHRGASDFSRYMALQRVLPALVVALLVLIALVLKFFVF